MKKGNIELIHGDCLEAMKSIKSGSIDAIITDPPYGTTACKWDSVIPFDLMWEQLNRIIKPNGAIVLFGSEPFSSALRMSNIKNYKYDWIWHKERAGNIYASKYEPMKYHEVISVFAKERTTYNKQMINRSDSGIKRHKQGVGKKNVSKFKKDLNGNDKEYIFDRSKYDEKLKNPSTILVFKKGRPQYNKHPTQKPVRLMEYLIKTYTNETETVLDFTMGSGSTGVAAVNLNRNFIGIEKDKNYFDIATKRIDEQTRQLKLF